MGESGRRTSSDFILKNSSRSLEAISIRRARSENYLAEGSLR